jgi:hypothetical protein
MTTFHNTFFSSPIGLAEQILLRKVRPNRDGNVHWIEYRVAVDGFAQGRDRNLLSVSQTPKRTLKVDGLRMPSLTTECSTNSGYQKSKTDFRWPTKEEGFILATSFGLSEANCERFGPDQEQLPGDN